MLNDSNYLQQVTKLYTKGNVFLISLFFVVMTFVSSSYRTGAQPVAPHFSSLFALKTTIFIMGIITLGCAFQVVFYSKNDFLVKFKTLSMIVVFYMTWWIARALLVTVLGAIPVLLMMVFILVGLDSLFDRIEARHAYVQAIKRLPKPKSQFP